jgi:hypothetical protein
VLPIDFSQEMAEKRVITPEGLDILGTYKVFYASYGLYMQEGQRGRSKLLCPEMEWGLGGSYKNK